jgi:hypothetical protein
MPILGWYAPGWPLYLLSIFIALLIIFDSAANTSILGHFFSKIRMDFTSLDSVNQAIYWD